VAAADAPTNRQRVNRARIGATRREAFVGCA